MKRLILLCATLCCVGAVFAKEAIPLAEDVAVEQRMIALSIDLRCLACQNESLAGSRAPLAEDLRREIRAMIRAGKSDAEIMDFLVSRYGDFVRYDPPLKTSTALLWFGPFALLLAGVGALVVYVRRRNALAETPLDDAARRRAEALLAEDNNRNSPQ